MIAVGCYSNCDAVELMLNGRSLGGKDMPRNGHLEWTVAYEPGTLEARRLPCRKARRDEPRGDDRRGRGPAGS